MRKLQLILVSALLLIGPVLYGQAPTRPTLAAVPFTERTIPPRYFALTWSPLTLAAGRPRMTVGALLSTGRWAYTLELEYGSTFLIDKESLHGKAPYELYGLRAELRRRFADNNLDKPNYLVHYYGLQGSYLTAYRDLYNRTYELPSGTELEFDQARRQEQRTDLVAMYTLQLTIKSIVIIESYVGMGLSHRHVDYTRQQNLRPYEPDLVEAILVLPVLLKDSAREGSYFRPAARAGIKLGLRF